MIQTCLNNIGSYYTNYTLTIHHDVDLNRWNNRNGGPALR